MSDSALIAGAIGLLTGFAVASFIWAAGEAAVVHRAGWCRRLIVFGWLLAAGAAAAIGAWNMDQVVR